MITRVVRMVFAPEKVDLFLSHFDVHKTQIRNFQGVESLSLFRDEKHENVYYTLSVWHTHADLEKYRNSNLFKSVWAKTKVLFADQPQAFSLIDEMVVREGFTTP